MTSNFSCLNCHRDLELAPDLTGQLCACPFCHAQFTVPHSQSLVATPLPTATEMNNPQPFNIQVNVPSKQLPKKDSLSVWLFKWLLAPAAVMIGTFGGCWFIRGVNHAIHSTGNIIAPDVEEQRREQVISKTVNSLKAMGMSDVSRDMDISDYGDGVYLIRGRGIKGTKLVTFQMKLIRLSLSDSVEWHSRDVLIESE